MRARGQYDIDTMRNGSLGSNLIIIGWAVATLQWFQVASNHVWTTGYPVGYSAAIGRVRETTVVRLTLRTATPRRVLLDK